MVAQCTSGYLERQCHKPVLHRRITEANPSYMVSFVGGARTGSGDIDVTSLQLGMTPSKHKKHTPKLPCMCQLMQDSQEVIDMRSISLACTPPPPANRSNTVCGDDLSVAHHFLWMHILDGLIYHLSTVAFSAISTERLSRVRMSCNL